EPDEPMIATNSPRATSRLTPCSAFTSLSPITNDRVRSASRMTGSPTGVIGLEPERGAGGGAGSASGASRASLGGDHVIALLQRPRGDLGHIAVIDADLHRDRGWAPIAQHPDH